MNNTLLIATALMTGAFSSAAAQPSPVRLAVAPGEVQKQIEAACRELLIALDKDLNQSWMSLTARHLPFSCGTPCPAMH